MHLEGQNIILRDWQLEDLPLHKLWHTGQHRWMDYDGPYYLKPTPKELEKTLEFYQRKIEKQDFPELRNRLVIADKKTDQLLGTVTWYWQSRETNWKSIGIAIYDEQHWSKGIGKEAMTLWIQYLFEQDDTLVRLDLRTWSGNFGMIKLGKKLGFKQEACFRKARIVQGKYYDSIGMGILREEWKNKQK